MISTFQALAVAFLALLPGASYTFAVERSLGSYGVKLADRLVRFLAASAVFHALASGPEYLLYQRYFAPGALATGEISWWALEITALVYVFVPIAVGTILARLGRPPGQRTRDKKISTEEPGRWARLCQWCGHRTRTAARWIVGQNREPRAWDLMWSRDVTAIVRIKLKSGPWLAGLWGRWESDTSSNRRSYSSAYPEEGDLYLSVAFQINPNTGELVRNSEQKPQPVEHERGLLVRWDEIEYIDVQEF
ncbi:DUF6338 family protein [Prauserella muralis]|uniref:Uncharacterized protein n=1 Tax=Prauserella muralis TaxID=588067 RepID=A0A2V4ADL3_9PSEU|nr:DUF6338 family protein [Prauserella muralis]PXY16590.1 hypothetical protein BAY60_35955 [Prauserella muralis]TWE11164.1 hypothetical protein FHX69_7383 [Prauserella muralis]